MRRRMTITGLIIGMCLCSSPVWATDYSGVSTEDMAKKRSSMHNASEQERNQYHKEWQKRMKEMAPEERSQYRKEYKNSNKNSEGQVSRKGSGKKKNKGKGRGNENGNGGQHYDGGGGRGGHH